MLFALDALQVNGILLEHIRKKPDLGLQHHQSERGVLWMNMKMLHRGVSAKDMERLWKRRERMI